jgi:predicted acyl esterase
MVTSDERFVASDGISLLTRFGGAEPMQPRPVIVEFSPYSPGCCPSFAGPDYNYLQVHIRGTGDSDGEFDALGPRTQQDVVEVLDWVCEQPWSDGNVGVFGFSASAITIYNSLHLHFPECVKAAVLGAGTHELYRDLLYPGGIPNLAAGIYVLVGIGGPAAANAFSRFGRDPQTSVLDPTLAMFAVGFDYLQHPTLDEWWRERGMRGDVNGLPILMLTSFFDVEPRGPFQAFQELRDRGAHMLIAGGHDGAPAGTESLRFDEQKRWYDRWLREIPTGVEQDAPIRMLLSNGDRLRYLEGDFIPMEATDWPVPGTRWVALALDPAPSGSAQSLNDGSLSLQAPTGSATQTLIEIPSLPFASDVHTTATVGGVGAGGYSFNTFMTAIPQVQDMTLLEPLSLSYTTAPLEQDWLVVGPASLELDLSSTATESDIFAVIADVWPDGSTHVVGTGRLRTSYPDIDLARSLVDEKGNVVQPYGIYEAKRPAGIGEQRRYHVEFWPLGNRFAAGHRLRLYLVGVSAYHLPAGIAVDQVSVGGVGGSRLLVPTVSP